MDVDVEKLKKATLEVLRASLPFRNRSIVYQPVYIAKIKGFENKENNLSFEHLAIITGNNCYFTTFETVNCSCIKVETLPVDKVTISDKREIGITMFNMSEILFAGNFIFGKLRATGKGKALEIFLFVICDSLQISSSDLPPIDDFMHTVRRVAESRSLTKRYYCLIV